MKLIDALRDLARYLTAIPTMRMVVLRPYKNLVEIMATDAEYQVVMPSANPVYSYFNEPIDGLTIQIGIQNTAQLTAIFKHPHYANAEATIVKNAFDRGASKSIMIQGTNGAVQAIQITTGSFATYGLRTFKPTDWHMRFTPTKESVALLSYWTSYAREFEDEENIHIFTRNGKVKGRFECGPGAFKQFDLAKEHEGKLPLPPAPPPGSAKPPAPVPKGSRTFEQFVEDSKKRKWGEPPPLRPYDNTVRFAYRAKTFLDILKLHSIAKSTIIQLSQRAALMVYHESECANYRFVIPGAMIVPGDYADMFSAMTRDFAERRLQKFADTGELDEPLPYMQELHDEDEVNQPLMFDDRHSFEDER